MFSLVFKVILFQARHNMEYALCLNAVGTSRGTITYLHVHIPKRHLCAQECQSTVWKAGILSTLSDFGTQRCTLQFKYTTWIGLGGAVVLSIRTCFVYPRVVSSYCNSAGCYYSSLSKIDLCVCIATVHAWKWLPQSSQGCGGVSPAHVIHQYSKIGFWWIALLGH